MAVNNEVILRMRLAGEEFDREFKVKLQDVTAAAEKQSEEAGKKAGDKFGKSFAAGLGAAGAAIGLAINSAANLGAELASTSKQFNIGVEALQVWRQAAANAGVSAKDLDGAFGDLTQKIGEANSGNRQAQQSFAALGIGFKTTAGEARATDAVMLDLAKKIASLEDPSERVRLGTALMGDEFKTLYPLLLDGSKGLQQAAADLGEFGAMLSQEEIQNLDKTNVKIEQMKAVLAIKVADTVAENAQSIIGLADAIATLTGAMIKYANEYPRFSSALVGAAAGYRVGGPVGAAVGGFGGLYLGQGVARSQADANMDPWFRSQQVREAQKRVDAATRGTVDRSKDPIAIRAKEELARQQALFADSIRGLGKPAGGDAQVEGVQAPTLTAKRLGAGGGARAGGGSRRPEKTDQQKADEAALKAEERMREAVARTLQEQENSARIAQTRADKGEIAAAILEAELNLQRQQPGILASTVEELAKALGYTKELTAEERKRLETQLAANKVAVENATNRAAGTAWGNVLADAAKRYNEDKRANEEAAKDWERRYTAAVSDVAGIYESLFRGGTKSLWADFKDEGTRIISEIAAQWTLALISGQPFNFNQAAAGAFGRSPLSSLLFGSGGGGPFGAANDNGGLGGGIGGIFNTPPYRSGGQQLPDWRNMSAGHEGAHAANGLGGTPFLQSPAFALGLGALTTSLVGGGTGSQIGGLVGSIGGQALGSSIAALGSFGGPVGAIAGALLGSILPKVLSSPKRASVTVGNNGGVLGITGSQGNSAARRETATQGAGSLIDAIFQIADQLGGNVDPTKGAVSFGVRKSSFRVDPTGRGITKVGNGAVDFGSDQEAAMRFAISDLIKDGVITGISQASQNLLQKGGDLDKQIEKALLIEQIPKLLKQRLDPLGSALDDLYDKFKKVNDALIEGSASAEQIAQARQLWELEKADAISSIGAASQSLKDFLAALNAGSSSPLSLREQRAEAERQLQPFLAQISAAEAARAEVDRLRTSGASAADIAAAEERARTAAAAINQDGFTSASQLLLSISRQTNASSGGYFADFDRIRALTGQAIGFVDQATARGADSRDPFARETAQNTKDAALILSDLSAESRAQGETLRQIAAALSASGVSGFIGERRAFAA